MIPRAQITAWRARVDLLSDDLLARELASRGGTALHKLHIVPAGRYSEDIDLVQVNAGPIGPVMKAVRARLEPWLGTKLRALYQRKKGRDLFDLSEALTRIDGLVPAKVVECFARYMDHEGRRVTRSEFQENLAEKVTDEAFLSDVPPLLTLGVSFDPIAAAERVRRAFLSLLPEGSAKRKRTERRRP